MSDCWSSEAEAMLAGAWGARTGELLERAAERRGTKVHRAGRLTMLNPPHLVAGSWCCWLFGEPEDRGTLAARFGLETRGDLPGAFAKALGERGERAWELLQGRFVVVALDRDRDRCLVARDQLGAQPLIYTEAADGVLFAEHERDLLDLLPRDPSPDRLALLQWIEDGLTPPGRTLYDSVRRVAAGHQLLIDGAHASVERWWSLRYQGTEVGTSAALAANLREAAFAAVGRAAAGSQRPAVKLSGGLDSACVAAGLAANGLTDGRAVALAGTFPDEPVTDERGLIEATAHHTRLPLERIAFDPTGSMLAPALEHIARWHLPPATPNLFLWRPLMARAHELGVDRMLDGEGGDELFGLAPYLIADMLHRGRMPTAWQLTGRVPDIGSNPDRNARMRVLRRFGLRPLVPSAIMRYREARRSAGPSASIVPRADAQALAELLSSSRRERRDGPLWWRYLAESMIDDRDLLGVGAHFRRETANERIDRRHPFLYDLQLTEAALRIPPREQFDPIRDRPLLREGLTGLIPEAVRTRYAKSHFTPLVLAGIQADEAGLIEPLHRADAPIRAYVATAALERKIGVAPDDRLVYGAGNLWRVAIANRWLASLTDGSS
jgi:asparagine synthetase B (glutamine-hydrolysing)